MNNPDTKKFRTILSTFDLSMIVVGAVIGSGIFLTPSSIVRALGDMRLVMLAWSLGGVMAIAGALTFAELAEVRPRVGGIFSYLSDAYGPRVGFMYGWCMLLVMNSGSLAALCIACATYAAYFIGMSAAGMKLFALGVFTVLTAINYIGIRQGSAIANVFSVAKILGIALIILAALFVPHDGRATQAPALTAPHNVVAALALAMVGVLWSFGGWQYATFPAGEVAEPSKRVPRGIFIGVGIVLVLYLCVNWAYLSVLPLDVIARETRVASRTAEALLGQSGASFVAVLIALSTFGTASVYTLAAPRIYYAMAERGMFFRSIGRLHPKHGTPHIALLAQWCIVAVFILSGTFEELISYVAFVDWIFYAAAAGAVFVFRRKYASVRRSYRTLGYPATPLFFMLVAVWFVVYLFYNEPVKSGLGLTIFLTGIPVSFFWKRNAGFAEISQK